MKLFEADATGTWPAQVFLPSAPSLRREGELPAAAAPAPADVLAGGQTRPWLRQAAPLVPLAPPRAAPLAAATPQPRPYDVRSASRLRWGARTFIVRAHHLPRPQFEGLLATLTPRQFAFIRSNVFVPARLQALHARLVAGKPADATGCPLRGAMRALLRGDQRRRLAYLFAYFHLQAGSRPQACDGAWFGVASAKDARLIERLVMTLQAFMPAPCALG